MAQSMVKGYIYSINRCIYIMLPLIGVLRHFSMFSAVLNQLKTFCLVVAAVTASQHEYQDHKQTQLHGEQMHLIICTCAFPITCKNVSREKQRCRSKHTGMMEKCSDTVWTKVTVSCAAGASFIKWTFDQFWS